VEIGNDLRDPSTHERVDAVSELFVSIVGDEPTVERKHGDVTDPPFPCRLPAQIDYVHPTVSVTRRLARLWLAVGLALLGMLQPPLHGQGSGDPTGLTAQVSGTSVTLSWLPPAAPPAPVASYVVQAGTIPGTTAVSLPVGNTLTFSVNAPVGVYYVRVIAFATAGQIGVSSEIEVNVQQAGVPAAPLGLQGSVSGTSVNFQWQPNPAGFPAAFYQLQAGTAPGLSNVTVLTLPAATLAFSTIAPPGIYYVRVAAGNAVGLGPPSNEVTVSTAAACTPTMPFTPLATVNPGAISLRITPRAGFAPSGYRLLAGSASGSTDVGVFDFPATTTLIGTAAPSGRYFVRLIAVNACGESIPSTELSFVVPPTNLPSLIGTWDGLVTNHVPRPSGRLITSFTLQLNSNPPFLGFSFGRFTSANCNHTGLAGYYVTSTGAPAISMESMSCTDGDFGLVLETLSATTAEGPCSLGGPNCRFSMKKR
jgi:hypothetical protein